MTFQPYSRGFNLQHSQDHLLWISSEEINVFFDPLKGETFYMTSSTPPGDKHTQAYGHEARNSQALPPVPPCRQGIQMLSLVEVSHWTYKLTMGKPTIQSIIEGDIYDRWFQAEWARDNLSTVARGRISVFEGSCHLNELPIVQNMTFGILPPYIHYNRVRSCCSRGPQTTNSQRWQEDQLPQRHLQVSQH